MATDPITLSEAPPPHDGKCHLNIKLATVFMSGSGERGATFKFKNAVYHGRIKSFPMRGSKMLWHNQIKTRSDGLLLRVAKQCS